MLLFLQSFFLEVNKNLTKKEIVHSKVPRIAVIFRNFQVNSISKSEEFLECVALK